jgi:hypothetical protein
MYIQWVDAGVRSVYIRSLVNVIPAEIEYMLLVLCTRRLSVVIVNWIYPCRDIFGKWYPCGDMCSGKR